MNKRQKKKLEIRKQLDMTTLELARLNFDINVLKSEIDFLEAKISTNKQNINNVVGGQVYMELENEEKIKKLKEENSILIEEQEKQNKRLTGIYIMILVVILLEVVQWWILHV